MGRLLVAGFVTYFTFGIPTLPYISLGALVMRKIFIWRTAFVVLASTLLVGCNEWTFSSVQVNPQILAGAGDGVFPVQLFVPPAPGEASANVGIVLNLTRKTDFTKPLQAQVTARFHLANGNISALSQKFNLGQSTHWDNVLLKLLCIRDDTKRINVELTSIIFLPDTGTSGSSVFASGVNEAKISADIEVLTWVEGDIDNYNASWNSSNPLEISCLKQ